MKILIAIDGSDASLHALRYVIDHPHMFGATPDLLLVNVHAALPTPRARAILGAAVVDQYYREESEEIIAPARKMLEGTTCKVEELPLVGHAVEQILAAAKEHSCGMIVMGTHGRNALTNLLVGSVTARVIAGAAVPVLVLK